MDDGLLSEDLQLKLYGAVHCTRAVLPALMRQQREVALEIEHWRAISPIILTLSVARSLPPPAVEAAPTRRH